MEKNPPLFFTILLNKFEKSCGTFGKEKKNSLELMSLG
jgi:hypothetical protein